MCNHEEADTRIMYHCTLEDKLTVVIATDTDILILMVYAFASRLPDHDWFLKIKQNKFVNVSKIHDYIGNTVSLVVPAMFVLTGCDTVSYLFRRSKKTIFERGLKKEDLAVSTDTLHSNLRPLYHVESSRIHRSICSIYRVRCLPITNTLKRHA